MSYVPLGKSYSVATSLPLYPRIDVDIPVEQISADVAAETKARVFANWPMLVGAALVTGLIVFAAVRVAQ